MASTIAVRSGGEDVTMSCPKQAARAADFCFASCLLITALLTVGTTYADTIAPQDRIPPGTIITNANWRHFARFMPVGMQTLFAGDHFWTMPKDLKIEVGPTVPIPLPPKYREDTERYRSQVKLKASQDGGYIPDGYISGVPFLSPDKDPTLAPYKIFFDAYYRYTPRLQRAYTCNYAADSYGNVTLTETVDAVYSQLAHLSDVGFPQTVSSGGDYFSAKYLQQISPEQGKYTTTLDITHLDITQLDDIYTYLPSARRPLRLSDSSRCAPLVGTDFTWEEANEGPPSLPQKFNISYLGNRKILALVHVVQEAFANCGTPTNALPKYYYPTAKSIVPWAMPALGKWELRDVYVIEMKRLPAFDSGYCYSNRVLYIDAETYFPLATELYDRDGKLYKFLFEFLMPLRVPQTGVALGANGATLDSIVNFKDKHLTISTVEEPCYNTDCSASYFDVERYASPQGLMKIVQ
jgi:hypothetical protein